MSRLGDMIKKERVQRGLTAKQAGKLGGVNERFILEVEAGTRIISDDAARRLLKKMGTTAEVVSDFEAMATYDSPPPSPAAHATAPERKSAKAEISESWLSAMGGVLSQVPIKDETGKVVGNRAIPTENGKIEGAAPEKVFYLRCPDASMRGYRLRPGDLLLVVPASNAMDKATMVISEMGKLVVRRVTRQDGGRALLQWFDAEPLSRVVSEKEIEWVGRAVRCEFPL